MIKCWERTCNPRRVTRLFQKGVTGMRVKANDGRCGTWCENQIVYEGTAPVVYCLVAWDDGDICTIRANKLTSFDEKIEG